MHHLDGEACIGRHGMRVIEASDSIAAAVVKTGVADGDRDRRRKQPRRHGRHGHTRGENVMGRVQLTADPIGLGATCAEAEDMRGESEASVAS